MNEEIKQLKIQIDELNRKFSLLENSTTIPIEVDGAFRKRFNLITIPKVSVSSKDPDSEDVVINEGGSATKIALNDPVGFLKQTVNGTDYYIPYFNA